jgi:hypothetical protein
MSELHESSWTLVAYVSSRHPRYSRQHLVRENGRTLCGIMPPLATHHHHNHSGRCSRCFSSPLARGSSLATPSTA